MCERLYPEMLQSIALTELMLQKWAEPPEIAQFDFSTLTQQILSVIAETGGLAAKDLYTRLVTQGAFRSIDQGMFTSLLRSLGDHDLIEQMPTGDVILGLAGEQIVRHYEFYSAFATAPEYRIVQGSVGLGTLPVRYLPDPSDHILFAGRRWQVVSLDDRRKEIVVTPAKGRKKPKFQGVSGTIHPRVRQMMRDVLLGNRPIAYLNDGASTMLDEARVTAFDVGLNRNAIIQEGASTSLLFTWTGTRAHRTLALMVAAAGLDCTDHEGIALEFSLNPRDLRAELCRIAAQAPDPVSLASLQEPKQQRKYDEYVNEQLLTVAVANEFFDVSEANRVLADNSLRG
jgi:ATP-dependent helicase Lhr and Lhr-like helicase